MRKTARALARVLGFLRGLGVAPPAPPATVANATDRLLAAFEEYLPQLGPTELYHQKLEIPYTDGQILGLHYAEPGSKSEQAVAMLAAMMDEPSAAPSHDEPVRHPQRPAEPA